MFTVRTLVVGDLTTNCYLAFDPNTNETVIIDPGDDADFITDTIINERLKPTAIVLTHAHFDHVLGCLELKLNFGLPIYLNKKDQKLYLGANQSAARWLKKKTLKVPPVDRFLRENDEISFGSEKLTVIETPGHTPGSICLYSSPLNLKSQMSNVKYLFTGDTLFADAVGRTDFSYSSPLQLTESLAKLKKLPEETVIYPGHGDPSTLLLFSHLP